MNTIYYVQTNIMCIIIVCIIEYQMRKKTASYSSAEMLFITIINMIIVLCVSDMVSGIADGMDFSGVKSLLEISSILYYEMITAISYTWMVYVFVKLEMIEDLRNRKLLLYAIPLIVFTILIMLNTGNHWIFSINELNMYERGPFVFLHWLLSWPYLIVVTAILVKRIYIDRNYVKMGDATIMLSFIIAPAISNIIQMVFGSVSMSQVGMVISVVIVYVASQNRQIQRDELTGLNNNRAFRNYIADKIYRDNSKVSEVLTIVMLDVDDFKSINDTYGHIEGDRALISIASALKRTCGNLSYSPFLCRYAGDEFVIAGIRLPEHEVKELRNQINYEIDRMNLMLNLPYQLAMSVGIATAECSTNADVQAVIRRADLDMYRDKKRKKENTNG